MRRHTDYENMTAAYDGLSPAERRELDAHLGECAACAADLAAYRQMDGEIQNARALKASAGLRVRFSEAMSGASAAPVAGVVRPVLHEPVIHTPKWPREPWTWTRALVPVGFLLIFALAIGLSLPRGGGNDGETLQPLVAAPPQQAEIVKLTFTCEIASEFANYGDWSKVITAFEEENPDIDVDIAALAFNATDAESYQQGLADMAAKTDVFCAVPTVRDWQRGVVADLGPYIANDPQFNPDDFYAGLPRMTDDGHSLSVPTYFRPMLMKYNPELFDKAGVPYPRPGWTWDEFLAAAKALTVRDGDTVTQWGYYELGAGLFSARLRSGLSADLQSLPDYATAADILAWFEKLYVDDPAAPVESIRGTLTGEKVSFTALDDMLSRGKVAMSNVDMRPDRTEPRHLAAYPDAGAGILMSYFSDLVMSGQTAHPDEAWRLLSYLSRHLPDGEVPARRSLAEQASFWQRLDESSAVAYRYALEHLTPRSVGPLSNDYALYQQAAVAVATGKKTTTQALADLDAQARLRGGPSATAETTVNEAAAAATAQPSGSVTTLEFHCEPFLPYDGLYQVIAAFEAENPDVKIHYLPMSATGTDEASYQADMADAAAKSDVFCAMPGLTELQRGIVADLAPYIVADASFRPDDFYGGALRPVAENGAILSVPTYLLPSFISYDPQAFDAAGLPYPQPGWTWDDFLVTSVKLTQREGENVGRWGFYEVGGAVFTGRLHAGWSADAQTPPDYAEMERILRWYEDMYVGERGAAVPQALSLKEGESISGAPFSQLLKAGKAAMWEDGGAKFTSGAGTRQVAAYPEPNQGAFFGRMGELAMSGQTKHPDLAWRWISYLSQHLLDGEIPARRSLAENASFWNGLDESSKAAYRYTLDHIAPVNVRFPDEYQHYLDAVIAVAKGEKGVEQALADLRTQVRLRGGP